MLSDNFEQLFETAIVDESRVDEFLPAFVFEAFGMTRLKDNHGVIVASSV